MVAKKKGSRVQGKKPAPKTDLRNTKLTAAAILVIGIAIVFAIYAFDKDSREVTYPAPSDTGVAAKRASASGPVSIGDMVTLAYTGKFENGTILDTSDPEVARQAGIYNPMRPYAPLMFTVGSREVLQGIEGAVLGMRINESKEVVIPPEQGHGELDPNKTMKVDRAYPIVRVMNIPYAQYIEVVNTTPKAGMTVEHDMLDWPIYIINASNTTVTVRYLPPINSTFVTMLGNATVIDVTSENILVRENPVLESVVMWENVPVRVVEYDDLTITMDYNHFLAGKTLYFSIRVEDIQKP